MFCLNCGTELPDAANFCMKCGKPQKEVRDPPAQPKVEYHEVFLDWAQKPLFRDATGSKKPPHEESHEMFHSSMYNRVISEIQPLLEKGWMFDDSYDKSTRLLEVDKRDWGGNIKRCRVDGCWVKLRRVS